jgi:hypothetical protein
MSEEPAELRVAVGELTRAVKGGFVLTDTDEWHLGQVLVALGSYLDMKGLWTTAHFEVWQHGLPMYSDVPSINEVVDTAFERAFAADLSPLVRNLLTEARRWEPQPESHQTPWKNAALDVLTENPYG